MVLVAAATIWALWTAFLVFPMLGLPAFMYRTAAGLLSLELVALLAAGYGSAECTTRPCSLLAEAGRAVAYQDVPALTALLFVLTVMHGVRIRAHHSRR
jgi:hypothetical protein